MNMLYQQLQQLTDHIITMNETINKLHLLQESLLCRKDGSVTHNNTSQDDTSDKEEDVLPARASSSDSDEPEEMETAGDGNIGGGTVSNDVGEVVNGSRQRRLMLQLPGLNLDNDDALEDEMEKAVQAKQLEVSLGNLIVFIRRLCVNVKVRNEVGRDQWIRLLLRISGENADTHLPVVSSLRTRVLTITLLNIVLPTSQLDADSKTQVVRQLFGQLGAYMWVIPSAQAQIQASKLVLELNKHLERLSSPNLLYDDQRPDSPDDNIQVQEVGFDPEKTMCCSVEGGHTLVHGPGGRGYGLASSGITTGCFQWKFLIVKESRGYEGTCVGVSRYPIRDYSHRTTSDMWLYRAYSGNLYHNGELGLTLPGFTQGDYITVVLDMEAHTLSFGKNGDELKIAFENIDATELFPCVMFYSTNPGEKVKMVDMQIRGSPKDLDAGEPFCAPHMAVMCETQVALIRELHESREWTQHINESIIERLNLAQDLLPPVKDSTESGDADKDDAAQSTSVENLSGTHDNSDRNSSLSQSEHQTVLSEKSDEESDSSELDSNRRLLKQQMQHLDDILPGNESDKSTSSCSIADARDSTDPEQQPPPRRQRRRKRRTTGKPLGRAPEDPGNLEQLCKEVWPALAVLGGVDDGLRVGGQCIVGGPTGRKAMVLGMLKPGQTTLKVSNTVQ